MGSRFTATYPFWSPDSQHIGYFARGKLMRVPVTGGAPLTVCDAPDGEGGTWFQAKDEDGFIVFAPSQSGTLHRVPAQGGPSVAVTTPRVGENAHVFPQMLPDGRRVLFTARGREPGIYVQTLGFEERTRVADVSSNALYVQPGILLYVRDAALLAHRLNPETLALEGEPRAIADGVRTAPANARAAFSASLSGTLVYRSGANEADVQVRWYTRDGKAQDLVLRRGDDYRHLELSPDGKRLAVSRGNTNNGDLWVKDLVSGAFLRLTSMPGEPPSAHCPGLVARRQS